MVNYPAQIDTTQSLPTVIDNKTPVQGIIFNRLRDAVLAIESELGITPSSVYATVRSRLDTLENTFDSFQIIELAGDLGGTLSNPKVIGLQGRPLSNALPSVFQFLSWNGISWGPSSITPGGDINGTYPNITVNGLQNRHVSALVPNNGDFLKWVSANSDWEPGIVTIVNGAVFPPAGSLVNGNVLQVTGLSSVGYGPVNLGGGAHYVVGILPISNQSNQIMNGDVTGTTNISTVIALQNKPVSSMAPTTNQILKWSGSAWAAANLPSATNGIEFISNSYQMDPAGFTISNPSGYTITNSSGNITITASSVIFPNSTEFDNVINFGADDNVAGIYQLSKTTNNPTNILNITAQGPYALATGSNRNPGFISLNLAAPAGAGTVRGKVLVTDDSNTVLLFGGDAVGNGNIFIGGDGILTAGSSLNISFGVNKKFAASNGGISFYGGTLVSQAARATNAPLTASAGTASNTISDVGTMFSQSTLNNNFQSIVTTLNSLEQIIHRLGLSA